MHAPQLYAHAADDEEATWSEAGFGDAQVKHPYITKAFDTIHWPYLEVQSKLDFGYIC
jgi:hypothetical protein